MRTILLIVPLVALVESKRYRSRHIHKPHHGCKEPEDLVGTNFKTNSKFIEFPD